MRTVAQKPKTTQQTAPAKSAIPGRAPIGQRREVNSILHLKRTIGNQAVQRTLRTGAQEPEAGLTGSASPRFGHDFSRTPIHPATAGAMQTKLTINESGDEYEQEANRVADKVMRMPEALPPVTAVSMASVYPSSASQPLGIQGVRSRSLRPQDVGKEKIESNPLTESITALIQRKPGDADGPTAQSPVKEEYNKAELRFYNRMGLVDRVIPSPDPSEPTRSPRVPEIPLEGGAFEMGWIVRNVGWKTAPEHSNSITIYDAKRCSGCRSPEDQVYRAETQAPSIISDSQLGKEPGKDEYEESFIISGLSAGYYEAFAEIDVHKEVDEIIEENNIQSMNFVVRSANKPEPDTDAEEETVQRKQEAGPAPDAGPDVESQISDLRGGGQPLPPSLRDFFEPRFGYDFSRVRIHADARAAESARKLQAKAFTVGLDVVFGEGQYAAEKPEGRHLLAHELTHVVQQTKPMSFNELLLGRSASSLLAHEPAHADNLD